MPTQAPHRVPRTVRPGLQWSDPAVLVRRANTRTLSVAETAHLLGITRPEVERIETQALVKFWKALRDSFGRGEGGRA